MRSLTRREFSGGLIAGAGLTELAGAGRRTSKMRFGFTSYQWGSDWDIPTMIAKFTTDIPKLTKWGEPLLIGPGSIHVAHTEGEYIEKKQLAGAIDLYCSITKRLVV